MRTYKLQCEIFSCFPGTTAQYQRLHDREPCADQIVYETKLNPDTEDELVSDALTIIVILIELSYSSP